MGKPTVLVVDDDPLLCLLLRETFELEGIRMREAGHVIEAEKIIAAELPDAIVLDVGLPGVDGLFYCERLRESPRTRSVPIVVISGSREAGVSALTVGAQGFFAKPFDPLQLLGMLERLLGIDPLHHVARVGTDEPAVIGDLRRLIAIGQRQHELLEVSYRQTVEALAAALESRDFGTSAHSQRVTSYATLLTVELSPALIDDTSLEWGFLLHDVGKIGVPDRDPAQAGAARRGGAKPDGAAHDDRRVAARPRTAAARRGARRRPLAPRALGRDGLPGRSCRGGRSRSALASSPLPTRSTR